MLIISEYLKYWKEALDSLKIELPENELLTLKAEVFEKENSEITLREYYGFKKQNYD